MKAKIFTRERFLIIPVECDIRFMLFFEYVSNWGVCFSIAFLKGTRHKYFSVLFTEEITQVRIQELCDYINANI